MPASAEQDCYIGRGRLLVPLVEDSSMRWWWCIGRLDVIGLMAVGALRCIWCTPSHPYSGRWRALSSRNRISKSIEGPSSSTKYYCRSLHLGSITEVDVVEVKPLLKLCPITCKINPHRGWHSSMKTLRRSDQEMENNERRERGVNCIPWRILES